MKPEETDQYRIGIYLGYPKCCAKSFIETRGALGNPVPAEVHKYTGFIPCPSCTKKIQSKEVTLEGLITNRQHSEPFPNDELLYSSGYLDKLINNLNK